MWTTAVRRQHNLENRFEMNRLHSNSFHIHAVVHFECVPSLPLIDQSKQPQTISYKVSSTEYFIMCSAILQSCFFSLWCETFYLYLHFFEKYVNVCTTEQRTTVIKRFQVVEIEARFDVCSSNSCQKSGVPRNGYG